MTMSVPEQQRLDKWLWAARFFKTRTLASKAIDAGHVSVNNEKGRPARNLRIGDQVRIRTPAAEFTVIVQGFDTQRRPAAEAGLLFAETEQSIIAREKLAEEKKLAPVFDHPEVRGRPTKKWRRQIHRFERNNQ